MWLPTKEFGGRTCSLHRGNHKGMLRAADGTLKSSYVQMIEQRFSEVTTREEALQLLETIRQELLSTKKMLYNEL